MHLNIKVLLAEICTHLSDFVLPFFFASPERDFELSPGAGNGLEFGEPKTDNDIREVSQ